MKSTFLFALACLLSLPMIVGCGKEPSEEDCRAFSRAFARFRMPNTAN